MFIVSSMQGLALAPRLLRTAPPPSPSGQRSNAGGVEGQFSGATRPSRAGQAAAARGHSLAILQPGETVDYSGRDRSRAKGDAGYGGRESRFAAVGPAATASLSNPAELELIQNYSSLSLVEWAASRRATSRSHRRGTVVCRGAAPRSPSADIGVTQDLGVAAAAQFLHSQAVRKPSAPHPRSGEGLVPVGSSFAAHGQELVTRLTRRRRANRGRTCSRSFADVDAA